MSIIMTQGFMRTSEGKDASRAPSHRIRMAALVTLFAGLPSTNNCKAKGGENSDPLVKKLRKNTFIKNITN